MKMLDTNAAATGFMGKSITLARLLAIWFQENYQ